MTDHDHFNSTVTFSIFPVNLNGNLYVKSTAEPESCADS